MPTYDYECTPCEQRFEVFESVNATGRRPCPKCGKRKTRRLIGAGAGFIFKGAGFYSTEYKKTNGGSESETKSEPSAKTPEKKSEKPKAASA